MPTGNSYKHKNSRDRDAKRGIYVILDKRGKKGGGGGDGNWDFKEEINQFHSSESMGQRCI